MNEIVNQFNKMPAVTKLVVLLVAVVLMGIAYFYVWRLPVRESIQQRKREVETLKEKLLENQAIAENKARFQEQVRRLREDLKQAQSLLPSDSDIRGLLRQMTSLGRKSGLDILLFQPGGESPEGFYARIPITLKLRGSYNDVAVFFDKVGKLKRIVNIRDINLTGAAAVENKIFLNVDCIATTFRFRG